MPRVCGQQAPEVPGRPWPILPEEVNGAEREKGVRSAVVQLQAFLESADALIDVTDPPPALAEEEPGGRVGGGQPEGPLQPLAGFAVPPHPNEGPAQIHLRLGVPRIKPHRPLQLARSVLITVRL